jgi:hypothetical protein
MDITSRTRYITNGKAFVRLGYFRKDSDKGKSGSFYNCRRWPEDTPEVTFLHNRPGPTGAIPMSWIRPHPILPPFLPGFIAIQERLIPERILNELKRY